MSSHNILSYVYGWALKFESVKYISMFFETTHDSEGSVLALAT
jgi:hypothetical protein